MPDPDPNRSPFDRFRIELDPAKVDEMGEKLRARLDELRVRLQGSVESGRYTKVRLTYRGKPVGPDLPLAAFLAGEGLAFMALGPLWALIGNLGARAVLDVELLHESDELVTKGNEAYMAGETEAAERCYRDALERRKDDPKALYHLGVLLRVTGRVDEARSTLARAAMGAEGHPEVKAASELLERMDGKRRL